MVAPCNQLTWGFAICQEKVLFFQLNSFPKKKLDVLPRKSYTLIEGLFTQSGNEKPYILFHIKEKNMRQETRRNLLYYLNVDLNELPSAKLADISLSGLLLMSKGIMKREETITGQIIFPESKSFEHIEFSFSGIIRWSKKEDKTGIYYTGIEFTDFTPQHERIINYIVKTIGFSDGKMKIRDGFFKPELY